LAVLTNSRYEHFAQLVATGQSPAQAYAAAGYEEKTAYTCGPRLLKRPEVQSRVTELQRKVAQISVAHAALSRGFVVSELMDIVLKAKQDKEWSAANRALELLGRDLGMFSGQPLWSGRLEDLNDEQLETLEGQLAALVQRKEKELESKKQLEAGPVIDIQATESQRRAESAGRCARIALDESFEQNAISAGAKIDQ
jgi:hypothetical protein